MTQETEIPYYLGKHGGSKSCNLFLALGIDLSTCVNMD